MDNLETINFGRKTQNEETKNRHLCAVIYNVHLVSYLVPSASLKVFNAGLRNFVMHCTYRSYPPEYGF